MEPQKGSNLCLLCCYSYEPPSTTSLTVEGGEKTVETPPSEERDNECSASKSEPLSTLSFELSENETFKRFCSEIELLSKDNVILTLTNQNFSTDILLNSLEFFKKLSVCPQCLDIISKIVEKQVKAREREENVRNLQIQLLNELKELQKQVSDLHEEMLGMERNISKSDVSSLEQFLEGFMPSCAAANGVEAGERKGSVHKASVILFRNNILTVINDLQSFHRRLTSKLECKRKVGPASKGSSLRPPRSKKKHSKKKSKKTKKASDVDDSFTINPLDVVEVKTELSELGVNFSQNDNDDEDIISITEPISGRKPSTGYGLRQNVSFTPEIDLTGKIGDQEDENGAGYEDNPEGEDPDDDMDFVVDDIVGSSGSASEDSSDDSASEDGNDEETMESQSSQQNIRRRTGRPRVRGLDGNDDDDDEDEQTEEPPKKKKRKSKKKKKEVPIPDSVNLDKQSEFRRSIISRIYWRLNKRQDNATKKPKPSNKSLVDPDSDPRKGYIMEYNPKRKCLFVEDVEVRFNDDHEVLQCTRCPFQTGQNQKTHRSADTLMFHHILGKHLEIYKCSECSQVLGSLHRWQDHIRGHQKQYCCDICGKPMYSSQSLYNHKWSHMNEEEMQEALAKGMRDPREKLQRLKERAALRSFICTSCGKGFQTGFLLRLHEQIHREDRERIQCTRCGKTFLPMGFYSHQKYTCRPDGAPVLYHPCHLCPDKVFKSKHLLKRHFDRTHAATAEDRPHVCEICGRGFKTRGELGRHGNAHLETRPFVCGRGCGAAFKHKKNCSRHEGNCNGMGTPRGKSTSLNSQNMMML